MRYCEDNRTYAVPNLKVLSLKVYQTQSMRRISLSSSFRTSFQIKELFYVYGDQKRVGGLVGELLDKLFVAFHKRKCRLIGFSALGTKDPQTGNFSGNLGLLQRREAQLYLKLECKQLKSQYIDKLESEPF